MSDEKIEKLAVLVDAANAQPFFLSRLTPFRLFFKFEPDFHMHGPHSIKNQETNQLTGRLRLTGSGYFFK